MATWSRRKILASSLVIPLAAMIPRAQASPLSPPPPQVGTPRVYVLDGGSILDTIPELYQVNRHQVSSTTMTVLTFLIVHPDGVLLWDTGLADRYAGRGPVVADNRGVKFLKNTTLMKQLAEIGYTPEMITHLTHSHAHLDHTGNSNAFAQTAVWLVAEEERAAMFDSNPPPLGFEDYEQLRTANTVLVGDNHDVFGDGTVVIKRAVGHTPGHSVLQVNLANSGPVILGGDLWHYPEELMLDVMPKAEETRGTPEARANIIALAKDLKAPIWTTHDREIYQNITRSPAFFD